VREEKFAKVEDMAASATVNPVSTASADDIGTPAEKSLTPVVSPVDAAEDPRAAPNDSSYGQAPGPKMEGAAVVETKPAYLRLPHQERCL
jgi:hypothetical protein